MLSGALNAAKRWGWITVNPLDAAQRPRIAAPQPDSPSAEEAAKIANAAWAQDADGGTFVWLTFITGARLGELVGLAANLGIDTHLHAIRHYSATELLAGGVDLRTVAGTSLPPDCRAHPRRATYRPG